MRPRIFVTQPIADSALKRLRTVATVKVNPDCEPDHPGKRALVAAARQCDILFSRLHDKVDRDVLAANPKLRAVTSMTITPDNIDVAAATELGIPVTVIPPMVGEATADIAFGLMLAVARRMVEGDRLVRKGGFPGGQSNYLAGALGSRQDARTGRRRRPHRQGGGAPRPRLLHARALLDPAPQAAEARSAKPG